MCSHTRLIYILTYRALREFASGRKSVNPIEELHRMETSVPYSVCLKTHDTMMRAQDSFNDRYLKPTGVHESRFNIPGRSMRPSFKRYLGMSEHYPRTHEVIQGVLQAARNRVYAHRAIHRTSNLRQLESTEWIINHNLFLPEFKYASLQSA